MFRTTLILSIITSLFARNARCQQCELHISNGFAVYNNDTINRVVNGLNQGKWIYFRVDSTWRSRRSVDCYKRIDGTSYCKYNDSSWVTYYIVPFLSGYYNNGLKAGDWLLTCDSFKNISMCATFNNDTLDNDIWGFNSSSEPRLLVFKIPRGWGWKDIRQGKQRVISLGNINALFDCNLSDINYPTTIGPQDIFK